MFIFKHCPMHVYYTWCLLSLSCTSQRPLSIIQSLPNRFLTSFSFYFSLFSVYPLALQTRGPPNPSHCLEFPKCCSPTHAGPLEFIHLCSRNTFPVWPRNPYSLYYISLLTFSVNVFATRL